MSSPILVQGDIFTFKDSEDFKIDGLREKLITASGHATINGSRVCIKGDEETVQLDVSYNKSSFPKGHTPGTGVLSIKQVSEDQLVSHVFDSDTLLLNGTSTCEYEAELKVVAPAIDTTKNPPVKDPEPSYQTSGTFTPKNDWVTVS